MSVSKKINDGHISYLIDQIGDHYKNNILNRFLRQEILKLQIGKQTWDQFELLTEKSDIFKFQGYHFDELYDQVVAAARFIEAARGLLPTLKARIISGSNNSDKILREITVNNFPSNLNVFADLLRQLFTYLIEADKIAAGTRRPFFTKLPELNEIKRILGIIDSI
jgi:hypothetical protein